MASGKFYNIRKDDLQRFLDFLSLRMSVYAPLRVGEGSDFRFGRLEKGMSLDIAGYVNTAIPPRELLLPEGETLLEYGWTGVTENSQIPR